MGKRIVYKNPEGGVSVVIPATDSISMEDLADQVVPAGTPYKIVDESEVPSDRTFRNAWDVDGKHKVVVDMPKARKIHKESLRELRVPKMKTLDVEFMRALEANDTAKQAEIAQAKQALRDATAYPAIEAAATPEELKQAIPPILLTAESESRK